MFTDGDARRHRQYERSLGGFAQGTGTPARRATTTTTAEEP